MKDIHEGIQRLLDNTGHFSREEWAEYLDVSVQALEAWCNGNSLPTPKELLVLIRELDYVKRSESVSPCIPRLIEIVCQQGYPTSKMGNPSAEQKYTSVAYVLLQERVSYILPHLIQLPFSACEEVVNGLLRILNDKQEELRTAPPLKEYPPLKLVEREEVPKE
jgi:hypothetical protein